MPQKTTDIFHIDVPLGKKLSSITGFNLLVNFELPFFCDNCNANIVDKG